ncbi:YraN family protein [Saccharothrix algeriensis]|uniref:Endonuclease n=1 Tax=Saccharothrix algeriensis TaxID=173560 RepID=A0A8T8HVN3_9PSEU|nr:YraN family protein [Saccharothrix algeriensis]MBM7813389.1 putative endonuclease [Saccharothrix algeriensis]QTR01914.1 YraN family protein [Saccharothrix algeriensis]
MPTTQELGALGEHVACEYLRRQERLALLHRNWRCPDGELDVVATDGARLVVCEVKCRSGTGRGSPLDTVSPAKLERVRALARRWRDLHGLHRLAIRCDLVGVLWPRSGPVRLHHLRGA